MFTTLARICKYGVQNLTRNGLVSIATVAIMILALLVFQGLNLFNVIASKAIASLQDKIDIAAYFKEVVPEDEVLKVERSLEALTEVKAVEYISKDKALEIFKTQHQNDSTISAALDELGSNPLLASLNIRAKDPSQYGAIAEYLEKGDSATLLEKVSYGQNKLAIDRLASIVGAFKQIGLGGTLFLALVAALVVFNTIRLAIHSNREELGVMRLVGASNKFINGPYIFSGIVYGTISAVLSVLLFAPAVAITAPYVDVLIPELSLSAYFYGHLPQTFFTQVVFGIVLGSVSAFMAARKYLKI
ncbi:MAG: permease-like cell division protein FtsX [Patescibacteria group bacterium]